MRHIFRILVLAAALVTGLTTVSAQTVQVLVIQKVPALPSAASNYLDDPFRYFSVQFNVIGAGGDGLDIFFDMEFSLNDGSSYIRTRKGSIPAQPIHLSGGINIMKKDVLKAHLQGRMESNVDFSKPLDAQQLPEGTYQLCVDIYLWSDKDNPARVPISIGPCPSYDICYSGSAPELVSPMAGAQMALNGTMVVTPVRKVNFHWTPAISNCAGNRTRFKYKLKVVQVMIGQNYLDAIKYNPPVFSAEVRDNTYAMLDTLRDVKVQMEKGAFYVAQVQAEQIQTSNSKASTFIIANDGYSQPLPFFWGSNGDSAESYGYIVDYEEEDAEEDDESEGVEGLTVWDGGAEEVSELEGILEEAFSDEQSIVLVPKRHYVKSDGYYTIPMTDDIEVGLKSVQHKSLKNVTYELALYDYVSGGVDSITSYEPLFSEKMEKLPASRILAGWGAGLEQGNLYYLQLSRDFTVGYWNYTVVDTSYYVNEMLAEHFHDTVSRSFVEERLSYSDGVFFQWGDDPETPSFTTPQWKAPVDRTGDDIYAIVNYNLPASVPEVLKNKTFPVSWIPVKDVAEGDEVTYEVNVYELNPGQTLEEVISGNEALVSRTVTGANGISDEDTKFYKVFSPSKTYVMTLSTSVDGESDTNYHFENGNEALPIVFKVVK